jgi:branched-chain amino acid transport system ATP-binding protein
MLEVQDLVVNYGGAQALKGVSLTVGEGEVVTLIGANGAGKTSLLRAISCLKQPKAGQIMFLGKPIEHLPAHQIVALGIAHIPEGRRVFGPMSVLDNLKMGGYARKDGKGVNDDLQRVFKLFPILKERRRQMSESLSGGEQQMLAVGRALMAGPKLLLMDEPSMGLSPIMVETIGGIVQDIHQTGIGILLVEQNATMALAHAHRAYVLETGRIVLQGPAEEVAGNEIVRKAYLGG